jgi:hypothetical protein
MADRHFSGSNLRPSTLPRFVATDTAGQHFATFTFFPNVKPFALLTSTQFLPPPPPVLTSTRYAQDLNETKELGSITSSTRTADQTFMSQLFAGATTSIGLFHLWNIVAGTVAQQQGLSLVDTARMFVLVNVGLHDGVQTSFTSKFTYGLWRPVTAIQRDDDRHDERN